MTRDDAAPVLVLDGPPGAGKTSLLARMVAALGDGALWFTEPNARLSSGVRAPVHPSPAGHTLWFLRHELEKAREMSRQVLDPATKLLISDRNHLGALAYCYATRAADSLPYRTAVDFYTQRIAPALPDKVLTAILLVGAERSLNRRGNTAERPRWRQWFDPELLERLRTFYVDIAPTLCPSPPLIIDTDGATLEDVLARIVGFLGDNGVGEDVRRLLATTGTVSPARPDLADEFADAYARLGGLEALGHPFSAPIPHRGATVQLCQLGALHRDASGRTRLWDPLACAPAKAA